MNCHVLQTLSLPYVMLVSVLRVTNYHILILLVFLLHHLSLFTLMFGGPALSSSGGFKYYASFIDDYSCYCWIYLIKHKSDVESIFYTFKNHAKRLLNAKVHSVLSDRG